jgi:membrane-bound metal-dependent hydrolase YbcI (DUF457 family)
VFVSHLAAGFAIKPVAPRVSLGWLIAAATLPDLLQPLLLLTDCEHVRIDPGNTAFVPLDLWDYPWSHSLVTNLGWGLLLGIAYFSIRHDLRSLIALPLGVFSHWLLDFVSHRPDLPLWPGGPVVGLGLWNSIAGTLVVETLLFVGGVMLYLRVTRPRDQVGRWGLVALLGLQTLVFAANAQGTAPPSVAVVAWAGMAGWLWVFWGAWIDQHRVTEP